MEYVSWVMYTFKCLHNSYLFVYVTKNSAYASCLTLNLHFIYAFLFLLIAKLQLTSRKFTEGIKQDNGRSIVRVVQY
jgi:hypothetical protein